MARILFVDDDPETLETLTKAVGIFGHQALLASCGEEALAVAKGQLPDLILMDMYLPDMQGVALLKRLKEQLTEAVPMLVLSAGPENGAAEKAIAAGARAYLNKPIRLQTLLDVIEEYTTVSLHGTNQPS